jgi:predicted metalloprotease with PDZ domain
VAEAGALFGTRMYRHYAWLLSLSDHVEHFGLEHHESSDDRTAENSLSEAPLREGVAELLAHEYVHSWNGKYRRPAGLLSPDYQKPMDGSLLWVYEGMTQYWGTVLPVRAGLITPDSHREMLASLAGNFEVESGNRKYSVAVLDSALIAAQQTRQPIELLVENDEFFRTLRVEYFDGPRFPHLTRIEARPDTLTQILKPRAN